MEKDIKLGDAGELDLKIENGIASGTLKIEISLLGGAIKGSIPVSISADLKSILQAGAAAIEARSPDLLKPIEAIAEGIAEKAIEKL